MLAALLLLAPAAVSAAEAECSQQSMRRNDLGAVWGACRKAFRSDDAAARRRAIRMLAVLGERALEIGRISGTFRGRYCQIIRASPIEKPQRESLYCEHDKSGGGYKGQSRRHRFWFERCPEAGCEVPPPQPGESWKVTDATQPRSDAIETFTEVISGSDGKLLGSFVSEWRDCRIIAIDHQRGHAGVACVSAQMEEELTQRYSFEHLVHTAEQWKGVKLEVLELRFHPPGATAAAAKKK